MMSCLAWFVDSNEIVNFVCSLSKFSVECNGNKIICDNAKVNNSDNISVITKEKFTFWFITSELL